MKAVIVIVCVLAVVAAAGGFWMHSEYASLDATAHASPAYCTVARWAGFPGFTQGQLWRCEMIADGLG